jgi:hypothetical protein
MLVCVLAGLGGFVFLVRANRIADEDFRACSDATRAYECQSQQKPITVTWYPGGYDGNTREWEVDVQVSEHGFFSFSGLQDADVAQLRGATTMEVRYRHGRPVAIVLPDGTAAKVPFTVLKSLLWVLLLAGSAIVLTFIWMLIGFVRVGGEPAY